MKVHVHAAKKADKRFYALTRDKSGKALHIPISFAENNEIFEFNRSDWHFRETTSIDFGDHSEVIQQIRKDLKENSVCILEIGDFPHKIYVYDVKYDVLDARLYSIDEDLARFNRQQNALEMSPMGEFLGHGRLSFVGTLENQNTYDLVQLGIRTSELASKGFFVAINNTSVHSHEAIRRNAERRMRKDLDKAADNLGIKIVSFHVSDVKFQENNGSDSQKPEPKVDAAQEPWHDWPKNNIHIDNRPNVSVTIPNVFGEAKSLRNRKTPFVIATVGVIASALTILAYFGFDLDSIRINFYERWH